MKLSFYTTLSQPLIGKYRRVACYIKWNINSHIYENNILPAIFIYIILYCVIAHVTNTLNVTYSIQSNSNKYTNTSTGKTWKYHNSGHVRSKNNMQTMHNICFTIVCKLYFYIAKYVIYETITFLFIVCASFLGKCSYLNQQNIWIQ